jgi:hypothetical protein
MDRESACLRYRIEYEVTAGLMCSASAVQLAAQWTKARWRDGHRAGIWLIWGLLIVWMLFFVDITVLLMAGLVVFLFMLMLTSYRRALFEHSATCFRHIILMLDDEGICLRTAFSENRYPWREVRALRSQNGWLAMVMTDIPLVIPVPDSAFADAAARQAFLDVLREMSGGKLEENGEKEEALPDFRQIWQQRHAVSRQMWRAFSFRALCPAEGLAPDADNYRFLNGLAWFALFTLGAQMAWYGVFDGAYVDLGAWGLRLLLLFLAYAILLLCVTRVLCGATVETMRFSYALCLSMFCLPWLYTGSQSAGIAGLLTALGLSEARLGVAPAYIQTAAIGLCIFWTMSACAVQFRHAGRAARTLYRVMLLSILVLMGMSVFLAYCRANGLWYAPDDGENPFEVTRMHSYVEVNEAVLYGQPRLLAESLAQVRAGVQGKPELFFLGVGGEDQDVFLRETRFVQEIMAEVFATEGHSLILVNHASTARSLPMANAESLRRAVKRMGEQMNGAEDVLFLFFTSHGSRDFRLSLAFWPFNFADISPQTLRQALDDAGIERRVLVISACYSGGFIPELQDENTLVITSAAADRMSFGCNDENTLTDFGRIYFAEALRQTRSIEAAFAQTTTLIAAEEKAAELPASLPQIAGGNAALRAQLAALGARE